MPSDKVFCADCGRLLLFHPALSQFICVACYDDKEALYDLEPYTGNDGL